MGKNYLLRFHCFRIKHIATLIIAEPKQNEYVWVYLYIEKSWRNGDLSTELTKYVLYFLKGNHHIHWLSTLKTFKKLSKQFKWRTYPESLLFDDCKYSFTKSSKLPSPMYSVLTLIVKYTVSTRKPRTLYLVSKKDENLVLRDLKKTDSYKHTN